MAALTDADRLAIWAAAMRESAVPVTKADLRAVVNAIDDWLEANKASLNAALPLPGRTALSTSQKARLLVHVVEKRWVTGV